MDEPRERAKTIGSLRDTAPDPQIASHDGHPSRVHLKPAVHDAAQGLVGKVLDGRFQIRGVLGRGGMGVVYDAHDAALGRSVVVKVLAPLRTDPLAGRRLYREARLACRVEHPSIVTVFHLGVLETSEPYIVMERLRGLDLAHVLETRGRLGLHETIALLDPIADALDALHAAAIVHRDVKPENVFLIDGRVERPRVKLIDFGLAVIDEESYTRLTRAGRVLGTAEYVAPETLRRGRATTACDVYSLATMAFEMLSGVTPFTGESLDIMRDKMLEPAPRLTERMQAPWAHAVGRVLARGLAQEPSARPSAGELMAMLRAIADQTPRDDPREAPAPSTVAPSIVATAPTPAARAPRSATLEALSPSFPAGAAAHRAVPWAVAALTTTGLIAAIVALLVDRL